MLNYHRRYQENVKLLAAVKFIVDLIMVLCAAYVLINFTCNKTTILGNSMNNTVAYGDTVLIDKLRYAFSAPKRFDIIAFQQPNITSSKIYVKRIIGMPGETIQITEGKVYINGNELTDDISKDEIMTAGLAASPIKLSGDEYFVLGDNRNNSEDSRFANIGTVKRENIIGAPWLVIAPINHAKLVR